MRLSAESLSGVRGERPLFSSLGFALEPGDALVLTGPNGSGKSSLLRLVAGFGRPTAGTLRWNGAPIADDLESYQRVLHFVGHQEALKPALTARETLRFWADLAGRPLDDTLGPLTTMGLARAAAQPCRFLSSGQRRRLALARLIAWQAPLWLLDEPTVGLDDEALALVTDLIERHRARGGIVLLATHQPLALARARHLSIADFPPARPAAATAW
ncbi:cytochrome c biogenesis ATP-binding export protein CcmA [Aliidongia dinghuensis]|uniref:Cytochrome c biogenesis ATP-binding export protein CcmA n=1 Tax=Aliidongia dinghuensis TaxID=1867774 RepID=A0A8J2YWV3_9PROT|nr:heme ABC exporter ATP-binding protein CcmA [Aliidongia dinghuensis]GGF33485.1 cytochrome c biogenesis ATP-binding export protein CcmA [Aliidongia dinghuensis]